MRYCELCEVSLTDADVSHTPEEHGHKYLCHHCNHKLDMIKEWGEDAVEEPAAK